MGDYTVSEKRLLEALSKLIKNKTVLIIAHRMKTIANADKKLYKSPFASSVS